MKVSVMVITYNHERFIAQALASILAQRVNFDYEIVVGEDCSTDRTREILLDFHRKNPNRIVPLLRDKNLGAARNLAATLETCRGRYVALIEGDDYWTCENKLQMQVDFLDANSDFAICCHRAQVLDEIGAQQKSIFPPRGAGTYTIQDLFDTNWIVTCSVMYRWGSVGPFPDWFYQIKLNDWPLHILIARSGKIHLMHEAMSVYRMHPGGMWTSQTSAFQLREMARMLSNLDEHLGFAYTGAITRTIAKLYLEMACVARGCGNRTKTLKYLFACLWKGGWQLQSARTIAGLVAYTLVGHRYRVFLKPK